VSRECSTHGEIRKAYKILAVKAEGKRPLGRRMHRWEDNIKIWCKSVDWIHMAQDGDQWLDIVVMNFQIP
jgi:hypothetical protein